MRFLAVATLLVAGFSSLAAAAEPAGPVNFLKPDHDYVITFAEGSKVFEERRGGITPTTITSKDGVTKPGRPTTWSKKLSVTTFTVVEVNGDWARVRHPVSADDYLKWNLQRRAKAILNGKHVHEIESKPNGKELLEKLRSSAEKKFTTTETWINLRHAVTIGAVPTDPVEPKITVTSVKRGETKPVPVDPVPVDPVEPEDVEVDDAGDKTEAAAPEE